MLIASSDLISNSVDVNIFVRGKLVCFCFCAYLFAVYFGSSCCTMCFLVWCLH